MADWRLEAALGSCLVLGLRHGFDYDHLAAISDITAVQRNWVTGLRLGITYALGHAFTVATLGIFVLLLHVGLPTGVDQWTERMIGVTLILLGVAVVAGILRRREHGHDHTRIESRLTTAINGLLWSVWRVRRTWSPELKKPQRFQWVYNGRSVFGIGILHGIGAETPSQLALFFLAKNLGGTGNGLMGLGAFCFGLVVMNGLMTATLGGAFRTGASHPRFYRAIAWTGAAYSCVIGVIFLLGISGRLPQLG